MVFAYKIYAVNFEAFGLSLVVDHAAVGMFLNRVMHSRHTQSSCENLSKKTTKTSSDICKKLFCRVLS